MVFLTKKMAELSIIWVNWNNSQLLQKSIDSIQETLVDIRYDLWVVDNASTDDSVSMLRTKFPQVNIIENQENLGFAAANNQAMVTSQSKYFLLINTDAFATKGAINHLYQLAKVTPRAGIIGAHLLNPDGSFQASYANFPNLAQEFLILSGLGRVMGGPWYPNHTPVQGEKAKKVDYVQGACLFVRHQAFEQAGGMDESYFMYSEEVDWCYSIQKAGWEVWYQPAAEIIHVGGASSRNRVVQRETDLYKSRVLFFRKHYGSFATSLLKLMIVGLTTIKFVFYGLVRKFGKKDFGRLVASPLSLFSLFKNI
jgi:N-acetylglucosaminyl-diphospho-decaprenol L-rhamnosyltransferase